MRIIIDKTTVEDQEPISYNVIDIPLDFALKDMLAPKQWGYFIRDGVVIISSLERIMQEQMEVRWYNILDLTIPDGMGGSIHIDMILLTDRGVIAIEMRDLDGVVFAGERLDVWSAMHDGRRFSFASRLRFFRCSSGVTPAGGCKSRIGEPADRRAVPDSGRPF